MSVKIMNLVWASSAGPAASRLVLLALADYADDNGRCWPSIATIAKKCGISARSVNRCIADLEEAGYLRREQRFNQSNVYVVTPDIASPPDRMSPPDKMTHTPLTERQPPPDNVGALTTNEPPVEPPSIDHFEEWWKHYPRKVAKGQARKAYKTALKKTDPDTLLAAVKAFSATVTQTDAQYIAHGSTWLNGERWLDETITPATADSITDWLRDCWKNADTKTVEDRSGMTYRPSDPPEDVDIREFLRRDRQQWITNNHDDIIRRVMAREADAA